MGQQAANLKITDDRVTKVVKKMVGQSNDVKQQTQLTEKLQKIEIESLNSKKLGQHLYYILRKFIRRFVNADRHLNLKEFKFYIS